MSSLRVALLALVLTGCGVDVLELTPRSVPTQVEVLVLGDVASADVERLGSADPARRDDKQLALVEPADGAVLPQNIAPLHIVWQRDKPAKMMPGDESFELSLVAGASELRIYTRDSAVDVPSERWSALLRQGNTLTLRVRALLPGPKRELLTTAERTLRIAPALPPGRVYFESTSGLSTARIDETTSSALVYPGVLAGCRTGHAVSRDGERLGSACSEAEGGVFTLPDLSVVSTLQARTDVSTFGAFDPSGTRFVQERTDTLFLVDSVSGLTTQALAPLATAAGARFVSPDWSPDGDAIVFLYWMSATPPLPMGETAVGGSLARVRRSLDSAGVESFGEPEVLLAAEPMTTLASPRYSPDGSLLVLESQSDKLPSALVLLAATGGEPVRVTEEASADKPDKKADATQPTWWPSSEPGHAYLVYSSAAVPGPAMMPAQRQRQLWLRDVDVARFSEPGAVTPALRLPFQSLDADNRRALFAPTP